LDGGHSWYLFSRNNNPNYHNPKILKINVIQMRKLTYGIVFLALSGLISCGPNKELVQSQARVDSLKAVVVQLNKQVAVTESQNQQLTSQIKTTEEAGNSQMMVLKNQNAVALQEAADCKRAKEAVARRMEELNQAIAANGISMKEIRRKAAEALIQFADAGVEVTYKNGLVYISMQEALLFKPGSAKLGKNGQQALAVVGQVLNENPNLLIYVVGNTDSVKVTRGFTDNWSLSTERANSIVRVLRDQYKVSMDRVTSAGRAKYAPVADNTTPEGRAKNRRTDIILNPDLSRLWDLVDKQQ
jgi:chemotaxis protein MotB